jgi:hypothetical protein
VVVKARVVRLTAYGAKAAVLVANEIRAKVTTQAVLITQRRGDGRGGSRRRCHPRIRPDRSVCGRPLARSVGEKVAGSG